MNSTRRLGTVFAHMSGTGSVVSHPNGRHVWTSGADGAIRCYNTELELLASFEQQHEGAARMLSITSRGDALASCGDDGHVKYYSLNSSAHRPQLKYDSTALTTSGTAHCVTIRSGSNDLAACGANKELKLINLLDTTRAVPIIGHSSTVKWVQYDPAGERIASLDSSGTLMVHAIPHNAGKPLYSANIMSPIDSDASISAAWSNNGELLAFPGKAEISIRTAESNFADVSCTLKADNNIKPITLLAFSPNDLYVAALMGENSLMIWDLDKSEPVSSIRIDAAVQSIAWCKRENSIICYDKEGYLRKWDKAVPSHFAKPFDATDANEMESDAIATDDLEPIGDAEDDEEMAAESYSSVSKTADPDSKHRKRLRKAMEPSQTRSSPSFDDEFDDDDDMADFIEDDTAGLYKADRVDDFLERNERKRLQSGQSAQPAFQSSSTPVDLSHKRRFLCWNLIGSVTSTSQGNFHGIEISFADSNKHKPIKLKDHYGLHIAALVEHGCIMASPYHDAKRPSVVTFKLFDSWTENSDWIVHLAGTESAICVAAGRRFVAVATDRQFVRIFSNSGVQLHTTLIQGPIVTMAASDDLLAVVFHSASGAFTEHQSLQCMVFDMKNREQIASVHLSLSPGSRLSWLSFNDTGLLLSMDSAGLLCGLTRQLGWSWSPLLDTNTVAGKGKCDTYWPVGLIDSQLMCALCRGTKYPSALSKPILQPLKLSLALVPTDTSTMEEQWNRDSVLVHAAAAQRPSKALTYKEQAALDKTLLTLVQHACTNNNNSRALDLCTEMKLMKSLEFALLVAKNARKTALAGRIGLLVAVKKRELELEKAKSAAAITTTTTTESTVSNGPKISINRFMNEGDAKAAEANKRRKLAATEDNNNNNMPTVHIHQRDGDTVIDVDDDGETELSYNLDGVHQTATVDGSSVVEAVKAKLDHEKQEEERRRKRVEAHKKALSEGVVELDEDTSFGNESDFMSKFNTKQKPVVAAAPEKKAAPTTKKPVATSSKPAQSTRSPSPSEPSPPSTSTSSSPSPPRLNPFAVKVQ